MSSRKTTPVPQKLELVNGRNIKSGFHNDSFALSNGIKEDKCTSKQLPCFQPDNFESIESCIHLDQVLDSRARETVFDTYRQAVMISEPIYEPVVYKSKKDGTVISHDKVLSKKLSSLKCTECEVSNFGQVMICLQCPHVGCAEHSQLHYKGTSHMFAIDSNLGLLYCFKCNSYINHSELEKLRLEAMGITEVNRGDQENIPDNYTSPNKLAAQGLKGFVNLGATCFMSSTLQTFVHNPIIKSQFFNNDFHYFNCKYLHDQDISDTIGEQNACITCSIDLIFKELFTSSTNEGFGITNLLTTAWYKQKSLAGFQEQDAHEFWQFILNEFHQDHTRIQTQMNDDAPMEETCTCITHSTFSFELQSCVKCNSCKGVTETVDPMIDLSLEINHLKKKENIDLYDCLDLFTSEEKLEAMISCKQCSAKSQATKTLKLKSIPPVLSIQLKRFNHNIINDTSSKVETPVKVPLYLNIAPYCVDQGSAKDTVFELFSVICHIGSVNTGHYVVYTKNAQGQWLKFDDSVVSIVDQSDVVNSNAYLLYYIIHNT
ncbi:hypothetical protein CANMA_004092 [Candida margitis]|uniref:uncharacterized protein n=1 Tax=Candida margitis TaxID=1775924 RepID=UPI0022279EF0|nr:uncharacterized protein CANMA_004092 [Candida margitis]KAI5959656.1 hypothetical protein CANMA_004092 [Candida margitis]